MISTCGLCGRRLKLLVHIQPWFCVKLGTGRQIGWLAWSFSPEGFLRDIWPGYSVHPTSTTIAIDRLVCVYSRTCTKYMRLFYTHISQFPYPRSFYCTAQLRLVLEPKETNSHILGGGGGKNTQKNPVLWSSLKNEVFPPLWWGGLLPGFLYHLWRPQQFLYSCPAHPNNLRSNGLKYKK